jgi:hypothetical protein
MNQELERMWKAAVEIYFNVLEVHFSVFINPLKPNDYYIRVYHPL